MTHKIDIKQIADDLRMLNEVNPENAYTEIDDYLNALLKDFSEDQRDIVFEKVMAEFGGEKASTSDNDKLNDELLQKIYSLILGREIDLDDLSSEEKLKRLGKSLNTIFDMLNHLIHLMNMTLKGEDLGEQTIRTVIGQNIGDKEPLASLEKHLGQINEAFLAIHRSFQTAAKTKVLQILNELDPEKIASQNSGGLKIGPLKKAEWFDDYRHKYSRIHKWFHSGRFKEDLLREFESNCKNWSG